MSKDINCFIPVIIGTCSPNASKSAEPEKPGRTIAETASAPLTNIYTADGKFSDSVETEKRIRLSAATAPTPARKRV